MKFNYDIVADALYLRLKKTKVKETLELNNLIVDIDAKGNIIGIEVLEASSQKDLMRDLKSQEKEGVPIEISSSLATA